MLAGPDMLCYSLFLYSTIFVGILVLLNSHLKSSNCLTYVDFTTATKYVIYNTGMHAGR